jgi:hypothetical protein
MTKSSERDFLRGMVSSYLQRRSAARKIPIGMSTLPRRRSHIQIQVVTVGFAFSALAVGAFQAGRLSVDAAGPVREKPVIDSAASAPNISAPYKPPAALEQTRVTVRDIATVPFSELYDVLKPASHEQLLAWARDLEQMPRGPSQRAAVTAYYKSLVQVDHRAAIEMVLHADNLHTRDVAIDAVLKAAPESIWGELAEMTVQLPYQGRCGFREDVISKWSQVDPVAVSQFIESHPLDAFSLERGNGEDNRLPSLLYNWAAIDPAAAREWLDADASRQTKGAFRAFVTTWALTNRPAAINYVVTKAGHPNLGEAVDYLAYDFVRRSPDDATNLILRLPAEQAKTALKKIARDTNGGLWISGKYEAAPNVDVFARWMVNLPVETWSESIGYIAQEWIKQDVNAATSWLNQLPPDLRDRAIASFCHAAESESAAQVITLGSTMKDQALVDKTLGEFARNLRTTREEAIDAINDLPISDEQREYLRKVMPEGPNAR